MPHLHIFQPSNRSFRIRCQLNHWYIAIAIHSDTNELMLLVCPFGEISLRSTSIAIRIVLIQIFQITIKLLYQFSEWHSDTLCIFKLGIEESDDERCMVCFQQLDTRRVLEVPC